MPSLSVTFLFFFLSLFFTLMLLCFPSSGCDGGRLLYLASINFDTPDIIRYAAASYIHDGREKKYLYISNNKNTFVCNAFVYNNTHHSPAYPTIVMDFEMSVHALSNDFSALFKLRSSDADKPGAVMLSA